MNTKFVYVAITIAIVIAIAGLFLPVKGGKSVFGSVDTTCQGFTTCISDLYLSTAFGGTGSFRAAGTAIFDGAVTLSSTIAANGVLTTNAGLTHSYTLSTSTTNTETLAASDVTNYESVIATPANDSATITLPASSTLSAFLATSGEWTEQCWYNATSTAGKTITFAAGTGEVLLAATTTFAILPQQMGCLKFMRNGGTGSKANDFSVFFD